MFQVSYFVFVLMVGGVTGCFLGLSSRDSATKNGRTIMVIVSAVVLGAFFGTFGFFWGVITVAELAVGALIGFFVVAPRGTTRADQDASRDAIASRSNDPVARVAPEQTIAQTDAGRTMKAVPTGTRKSSGAGWVLFICVCLVGVYVVWLSSTRRIATEEEADTEFVGAGPRSVVEVPSDNGETVSNGNWELPDLTSAVFPSGLPPRTTSIGSIRFGGRIALVTGTDSDEGCHACGGSISVYYLTNGIGGLEVERRFPDEYASGAWGEYSREVQLTDVLGNRGYAAMIVGEGYTAQGCTSSTTDFILFADAGPRVALSVRTGAHDDYRDVQGEVSVGSSSNSPFQVRYERKRPAPEMEIEIPIDLRPGPSLVPRFEIPAWASETC